MSPRLLPAGPFPEPGGRWTLGHEATVAWDIRGHEEDLTLRVDGFALLYEKTPLREIDLWANDRRIASWRFQIDTASPLPARIPIPRKLIRNRDVLMLTFRIRNPVCPAELGISPDTRALGLHLCSLTLKTAVDRLAKVGDTLNLADTGIDEPSLIAGWSFPEPGGRWTLGHEATVAWDIRGHEEDLTLRVDGFALLYEKTPLREIDLWANDRRIASWRFQIDAASPLPARIPIPRKLIRNRDVLMLTFRIRNPFCPAELGISPDTRALGLHLCSLTLKTAVDRLAKVGDTLNLADTGIDEPSLIAGWSFPEPGGRWTLGHEATVAWDIRGHEEDLTLRVDGFALLYEKTPLREIDLWANDRRIASWRFQIDAASPLPARIPIPRKLIRNRDVLMLTFRIRNPFCPAELGISPDTRALGLHLCSLTLKTAVDRLAKVGDTPNLADTGNKRALELDRRLPKVGDTLDLADAGVKTALEVDRRLPKVGDTLHLAATEIDAAKFLPLGPDAWRLGYFNCG